MTKTLNHQVCFITADGYRICNAVRRNGVLVFANDKWFKFKTRKKR